MCHGLLAPTLIGVSLLMAACTVDPEEAARRRAEREAAEEARAAAEKEEREREEYVQGIARAGAGNTAAQYNTGWRLWNGHGVREDPARAVIWYRKAAEQGHAGAANNLGVAYDRGLGVPQNGNEARRWYRAAAVGGNGLGACNLARELECMGCSFGIGGQRRQLPAHQDEDEAYFWFVIGASRMEPGEQRDACVRDRNRLGGRLASEVVTRIQSRAATWKPGEEF